jgi:Asp/Glu/hydantoin racemase
MTKRIFLVHPTTATMPPLRQAFIEGWPEARVYDLLDQSMYEELGADGALSAAIHERVRLLFEYCRVAEADAILFTGSTFGPAVDSARRGSPIPIVKPDEGLAEAAVRAGRRITVYCTAKRALPIITAHLRAAAAAAGREIEIAERWVPRAQSEAADGRHDEHDRLIAEAVEATPDCEVVVLGQISMTPARRLIPARPDRVVLTSPETAVAHLRHLLATEEVAQ